MSVLTGDFIGFSYNGVHSSELGIFRTSEGSRFNENLLPASKDVIVQVPGGDGTYYFGSYYTQRSITISYAFDELTENQFEYLKQVFGDKKIHPLVFDERPYKTYYAKVTGTTSIKHIPFTINEQRIYKGEGSIQFTCYQPFAVCHKKFLKEYDVIDASEWANASNLLYSNEGGIDSIDENGVIKIYNPGVKDADWRMSFESDSGHFGAAVFKLEEVALEFEGAKAKAFGEFVDSLIVFNSKTKMIEGYYKDGDSYLKSGNLYNEYLLSGDFFDIPITIERDLRGVNLLTKDLIVDGPLKDNFVSLDYNYYYF